MYGCYDAVNTERTSNSNGLLFRDELVKQMVSDFEKLEVPVDLTVK